jgi:hypothetical protein
MQVSTSFPDSTYSSSNLPSVTTLQADISALETAHNETDSKAIREDGTNSFGANQSMGGHKLTNVGTPSADTDGATLGIVNTIMQALHPVGSLYFNASDSTNPATLLGFGTWVAFGAGRMMVGYDPSDADFNAGEKTGGAKTKNIAHTHDMAHTHTHSHTHTVTVIGSYRRGDGDPLCAQPGTITTSDANNTTTSGASTSNTGSGGSATQDVMNPFITVFSWKRTA